VRVGSSGEKIGLRFLSIATRVNPQIAKTRQIAT
jgi:hypothetical protein